MQLPFSDTCPPLSFYSDGTKKPTTRKGNFDAPPFLLLENGNQAGEYSHPHHLLLGSKKPEGSLTHPDQGFYRLSMSWVRLTPPPVLPKTGNSEVELVIQTNNQFFQSCFKSSDSLFASTTSSGTTITLLVCH